MTAAQTELSMDEILASIRRIIHEEETPAPEPPRTQGNTVALRPEARSTSEDTPEAPRRETPPRETMSEELATTSGTSATKPVDLPDFGGDDADADPAPEEAKATGDVTANATEQPAASARPASGPSSPADVLADAPAEPRPPAGAGAAPSTTARGSEGDAEAAAEAPAAAGAASSGTTASDAPKTDESVTDPSGAAVEGLVSEQALHAAAAAFATLKERVRVSNRSEATLEGLVQEMLRPMLKAWLDENLPAIVERQVEAEIRRLRDEG